MDSLFLPQALGPAATPTFAGVNNTGNESANNFSAGTQAVTANATLTAMSPQTTRANAASAAITITLPAAASVPGRILCVKKIDSAANNVTVAANAAETIDGTNTKVISSQYTCLIIQSNSVSWDILSSA